MGLVLRTFGSIPKRKFTTDPGAIRTMKKWVDLGGIAGSYPEIRGWLEDRLRIDQSDERNHAPVRGRELAHGLDNPLFRCPTCFARRMLEFRSKAGEVYEVMLPRESPLAWAELVEHWRKAAQG